MHTIGEKEEKEEGRKKKTRQKARVPEYELPHNAHTHDCFGLASAAMGIVDEWPPLQNTPSK